jgi:DNA-cytosine methyltransferase
MTTPVKKAISLFSGAGGDTEGLEAAGYTVVAYSENNATAIATHQARFPASTLLKDPTTGSTDIRKIPDATFAAYTDQIEAVFAGFPCFVAGTKVLTQSGYKAIETVTHDDVLMTHTGKHQRTVNLQRKLVPVGAPLYSIRIKYHPTTIVGTAEHPFYVRTRLRTWDATSRKYTCTFQPPQWKPFHALTKNDFCGMVINTDSTIPAFTVPLRRNASRTDEVRVSLDSKDAWYTMGYFLGDGWVETLDNKIRFAINDADVSKVLPRIQAILPITDKGVRTGKCAKYGCASAPWHFILSQFGKYAHGKTIPEWVHRAPVEMITEFLAGYLKADGCVKKNGVLRYTTVSHNIAFGVQRLYLKLGHIVSVNCTKRPPTHVIQGRTVNQRDTYEIDARLNKQKEHSGFIDCGYAWMAPHTLTHTLTSEQTSVYNFEVAEDNSYIVENTVVHNCQGFSHAGKKRSDDPRNELVYEFARVTRIVRPRFIIGENVSGLLGRKGRDPGQPQSAPLRPVIDIIRDLFAAAGYRITYRVVAATEVGVPQKRKRLIIVGYRSTRFWPHIEWPTPPVGSYPTIRHILETHLEGAVPAPAAAVAPDPRFWITTTATAPTGTPHPNLVRLAGGIRNLSTKELAAAPAGTTKTITESGGLISFGTRSSSYHGEVVDPDAPSKTIICTYGLCPRLFVGLHNPTTGQHWIRCLSPRELAQIQGFPADYPWAGDAKSQITQIGNAVPPPLAAYIGRAIQKVRCRTFPQEATSATADTIQHVESEDED